MDRTKLKKEMLLAASSDEEFDKYAFGIGFKIVKTFIYGAITGVLCVGLILWILYLMLL
jgi:hypothetical protein